MKEESHDPDSALAPRRSFGLDHYSVAHRTRPLNGNKRGEERPRKGLSFFASEASATSRSGFRVPRVRYSERACQGSELNTGSEYRTCGTGTRKLCCDVPLVLKRGTPAHGSAKQIASDRSRGRSE